MDPVRARIEGWFPGLARSGYEVTSPEDPHYNCLAWAAKDTQHWWEPDLFWPEDLQGDVSLASFLAAFRSLGYESCQSEALEPGCEKVALFAEADSIPTHAARQLESGRWTSKLGSWEDIEHELPALEGGSYGRVVALLERPRPS